MMDPIKKEDLKTGSWYLGAGRGSSVALWTGHDFVFVALKFSDWTIKFCDYADEKSGCFVPMEEIASGKYPHVQEFFDAKAKDQQHGS